MVVEVNINRFPCRFCGIFFEVYDSYCNIDFGNASAEC